MAKAAPTTSAGWRDLAEGLREQIAALAAERDALREKKREDALPAANGDKAAQRRLETINGDVAKAEARIDDLSIAAEEADRNAAQAESVEAEEAERQRLIRIRELARQRIAKAEAVDRAIAELAAPLGELAETSARLADLIAHDGERDGVRRWRWAVVTRLGRELHRLGIDDLPQDRNDRPTAERLKIGAVDWTDKLVAELARRAAAGEEVEGA